MEMLEGLLKAILSVLAGTVAQKSLLWLVQEAALLLF